MAAEAARAISNTMLRGCAAVFDRVRAFAAEDRLFFAAFLLLSVLFALPLILVSYAPMQDFVAHVRIAEVWRQAGHGASLMATEHGTRSWLQPYVGYHLLLRGLGLVLPLLSAQKVLLLLYTLSVPLSFLYLLLSLGRDRRYALLSFGFIYNAPLIYGLFPQALSLPLILVGLGVLRTQMQAPSLRREMLIGALTVALFFFHFAAFFTFGLAAIAVFLCNLVRVRDVLRRGLFALPALGLATYWALSTIESHGFIPVYWSITTNLANFRLGLTDILVGGMDEVALLAALFTVVGCLMLPVHRESAKRDWAIGVAGMVLCVAVFVLPAGAKAPAYIWAPNLRLALPGVLLLVTIARADLARWRAVILAPALVAFIALAITLTLSFLRFDTEARKIDALIAKIPADKKILPLLYEVGDGVHRGKPYMHLPELYQLRQGGFVAYGFVGGPAAPVFIKHPPAAPIWFMPLTFNYQLHGRYHYFLAIWPEGPQPPKTFVGAGNNVRLVDFSGRFCLYENVGPLRPK